jgi:hypothetical protein
VRAVLDPNVLVAALLSARGAPGQIVTRWLAGELELVVSDAVLAELRRALAYPKLRARIASDEAAEFVALLATAAVVHPDPPPSAGRSADPGDDYLLTLAEAARAVVVSGDRHLLELGPELPIHTPRAFLDLLG